MIEFLCWVDVLPIELFNLYVSLFAGATWIFTSFVERISNARNQRLERNLDAAGFYSVRDVLREPVLVELDDDSASRIVYAAAKQR